VATIANRVLDEGARAAGQATDPGQRVQILAEPRTNSLILRAASPSRLALAKQLIERLDRPSLTAGDINVVYLRNAEAVKLAPLLRAVIANDPTLVPQTGGRSLSGTSVTTGQQQGLLGQQMQQQQQQQQLAASTPAAGGGAAGAAGGLAGMIQPDAATNSLIITAPEPLYRNIRAIIDKLDQRRAQVFVESLIAEVSEDKAAEFGIQWQGPIGQKGDGSIGLLGTNFTVGGANILQLASQPLSSTNLPSAGANFGVATRASNGTYVLGFLARFLQSSGEGNVLSTPNLLTLDNEEAKIVIGQNVPFVTGQYTNANATGTTVNPFQTIERKDVGLTLRVKPQISESGTIKMQIYQEVSSLDTNTTSGLITNKRSIESNVLVDDGSIIVLGGLLQDTAGNNQQKVPGLGDIPLFGNLFKAETRSRKKTNLMLFLRPVVVRDGSAAEALSMGRYEQMRTGQQSSPLANSTSLSVQGAAVLPPLPPQATPPAMPGNAPATKP